MRIVLEEPYASRYRKGYLRRDSSGRGRVDLVNTSTDRTTVSYARYLVEVQMNAFIPAGYEVDHIDADCSNDDLSNLQVLTVEDHLKKSAKEREGRAYSEFICPYCGTVFHKETRNVTILQKNVFCSYSCNAKYSMANKTAKVGNPISKEKIEEIKKLASEGLTGYRISKITGISGNTVLKYMREVAPVPERSSKA